MLEYAGTDATNAFKDKPHTIDSSIMLHQYLIGELVEEDRLYDPWFRNNYKYLVLDCWNTAEFFLGNCKILHKFYFLPKPNTSLSVRRDRMNANIVHKFL